jgi:hypothetical protein
MVHILDHLSYGITLITISFNLPSHREGRESIKKLYLYLVTYSRNNRDYLLKSIYCMPSLYTTTLPKGGTTTLPKGGTTTLRRKEQLVKLINRYIFITTL